MSSNAPLTKNYSIFTKWFKKMADNVKTMLKKVWEVDFLISNFLVPTVLLAFYCGSFAYVSSRLLPEGVNFLFVTRLWKYILLLMAGICLTIFVIFKLKKGNKLSFTYSSEKFFVSDFILLLLPLTPVVQYILNNQDVLSPIESLSVLVFFLVFSGIYIFAIPACLTKFSSTRTLMILGLAFVFTIINMASLSHYFFWFRSGSLKIQLMFFGGVFLVTWLLYSPKNKVILYLFIVMNFVANSTFQLLSPDVGADEPSLPIAENKLLSFVEGRTPAVTPNIYLLVYDAYVPNETMLAYGINNSSQEDYLREQGFELYPHTYSVAAATTTTMSRVLNASTEFYGPPRKGTSGDGIVQNTLKHLGYKTYGIFPSDFMFLGIGSSYDFSFPENSASVTDAPLLNSILIGEFRFDQGFNNQPREQFIETKQSILEGVSGGNPVFIYTHSDLPKHSQNSGACLPDETDLFKERLTSANIEMRQDIKTITENDPDAIVIIAGDHGPYLTKNCTSTDAGFNISEISRLDIQDRFGTFLAIRWPTQDFTKYDDITVLQDSFPAVFAYLYKDEKILEAKIEPVTIISESIRISGASVKNGVIYGGINDGEPLFLSDQ